MSRTASYSVRAQAVVLMLFLAAQVSASGYDVRWFKDDTRRMSLEDIRSLSPTAWQSYPNSGTLNFGFSEGAAWLRVVVPLPPVRGDDVLAIRYPLLDRLSVYWFRGNALIERHETGDSRPFATRPILHRHFMFPVPAGTQGLVAYLRVQTDGSLQIPIRILPAAESFESEVKAYGWHAIFAGIIVSMSLYNLFVFFMVRQRAYLWYVVAVATAGLAQLHFQGLLFQWLWPDRPGWNNNFTVSVLSLTLMASMLFTLNFLAVHRHSRKGYRLLQILFGAALFCLLYGLFGSYQVSITLIAVVSALATPAAWLIGIMVWRKGQAQAGFYVLAWTPLLLGYLLLALSKLGYLPRTSLTETAAQIGVALEVILLSFALAYRINLERQKRLEAQKRALLMERKANVTLEKRVQERTDELERANEQLKAISLTDGLTRIANRRRFDEKLEDEWKRAQRHGHPVSLLMLDIDHFKRVNDELGHLVGDDCLTEVAALCAAEVQRSGDLLARYGGEEFSILLPATPEEGAVRVAERVRQAVARSPVHSGERVAPVNLTISVGVACLVPDPDTEPQELIRQADEALYAAKESGRNRVMVARDFRAATVPGT